MPLWESSECESCPLGTIEVKGVKNGTRSVKSHRCSSTEHQNIQFDNVQIIALLYNLIPGQPLIYQTYLLISKVHYFWPSALRPTASTPGL